MNYNHEENLKNISNDRLEWLLYNNDQIFDDVPDVVDKKITDMFKSKRFFYPFSNG